ncbi:mediator of RNA polymerase II transcription subunit 1-like [Embiotoca jacksoni]|uniref:mediator of RNA polymerase II transcription subunit 1-like n=1 Tax=Embiotoca jacksoni TaxID=100190 RepID=UPI003703F5F1
MTWNDTFQLVRRCMEKSRDESKPCEPMIRCLKRLQEVFSASRMNPMRSRLEIIAKQHGMGFHISEATCYLTADLFYLEVQLLPSGTVEEVKVASHGKSPVPSESFLQLLRLKKLADFSTKLGSLFAQYNIPGDNEIKLKLLASLQHLGKNLRKISNLPRTPKHCDPKMEMINNGWVGYLIAGKEDCPLTVQFFTHPGDEKKTSDSHEEAVVHAAQVTVGVSDVPRQLQMACVVPKPPQLDPCSYPVFTPPSEMLPACFLLQLQPAITMMSSFVKKLGHITAVTVPDVDLQWAPLPKLLMRGSLGANNRWGTLDQQETTFQLPLPSGVMHSYIFPGAAWSAAAHKGATVGSVPFTHPAHVPALLELLRQQCTINTLLGSCFAPQQGARPGSGCDVHFEVLPESDTSFSVTFQRPDANSLAVLQVSVLHPHRITCRLFGAGTFESSLNEYLSTVMMRCLSVPVTMGTLYSRLEELTSAPLSAGRPESEHDRSSPSSAAVTDINRGWAALPRKTDSACLDRRP